MHIDIFIDRFDSTLKEIQDFVEGDDIKHILGSELSITLSLPLMKMKE